jgi:hypothetical protein
LGMPHDAGLRTGGRVLHVGPTGWHLLHSRLGPVAVGGRDNAASRAWLELSAVAALQGSTLRYPRMKQRSRAPELAAGSAMAFKLTYLGTPLQPTTQQATSCSRRCRRACQHRTSSSHHISSGGSGGRAGQRIRGVLGAARRSGVEQQRAPTLRLKHILRRFPARTWGQPLACVLAAPTQPTIRGRAASIRTARGDEAPALAAPAPGEAL